MRVVVAGMLFSLLLLSLPFAVFDALADVDGPWWLGLVTAQALFLATLTRTLLKSEGENGPLPHSAFQAMIDCNIQPMTRAERFLPPAFGVRGSPAGRGYIDGWIETTECTEQVLHRQVQLGGGGAATHGHPRPPNGLAAPQGEKAHRRAAVVVSRARMLRVTSSRNMRQRSPVFFPVCVFLLRCASGCVDGGGRGSRADSVSPPLFGSGGTFHCHCYRCHRFLFEVCVCVEAVAFGRTSGLDTRSPQDRNCLPPPLNNRPFFLLVSTSWVS